MVQSRIGDQLEMFGLEVPARVRVPWGGVSPRDLTREGIRRIFQARRKKGRPECISPGQLDMFDQMDVKAPRSYRGAPLLLPLP